jgi:hypothetical protein
MSRLPPLVKWLLAGWVVLAFVCGFSLQLAFSRKTSEIENRIRQADLLEVRSACRKMIHTFNERGSELNRGNPWVIGRRETAFVSSVPPVITNLNPSYVRVTSNHVVLCMSALPRVYLLVFDENTREYGTERVTDGIWLSGNPSEAERRASTTTR